MAYRKHLEFFQNFSFVSRFENEALNRKTVIRKPLNCIKRDLRSPPQRNSTEGNSEVRKYSEERLELFSELHIHTPLP